MEYLPDECLFHIFCFLEPDNLIRLSCVSKQWNYILDDDTLWAYSSKNLFENFAQRFVNRKKNHKQLYINIKRHKDHDPVAREFELAKKADEDTDDTKIEYALFCLNNKKFDEGFDRWALGIEILENIISDSQNEDNVCKSMLFLAGFYETIDTSKAEKAYRDLLRKTQHPYVLTRYAIFCYRYMKNYKLATKIFVFAMNVFYSYGGIFFELANFMWKYIGSRENVIKELYSFGVQKDGNLFYFVMNYMNCTDQEDAEKLLEVSPFFQKIDMNNFTDVENLALCYHEIDDVGNAEKYYRNALEIDQTHPHAYSNLGELLLHDKFEYDEAIQMYQKCIDVDYGCNSSAEVMLLAARLAKGEKVIDELYQLLQQPHIQKNRANYLEGLIIYFIHANKEETLREIKIQLITHRIRHSLKVSFNANIRWGIRQGVKNIELIDAICKVYNSQLGENTLDQWKEWYDINVSPFQENNNIDTEIQSIIGF